jgi:hypothetical protein
MTSLTQLAQTTKDEIKALAKPLSSYQYYLSHMRENWGDLTDEDKGKYNAQAEQDLARYLEKKEEIRDAEKAEIRKREIFLSRSYCHVNCVGLDNGWYKRETVGPAEALTEYSEKDQAKYGVKYKYITIAGFRYQHNEKYWKRMGGGVGGGSNIYTSRHTKYPDHEYSWHLSNAKEQSHKRFVRNCYDKSWEEDLELSWHAVKP